MRDQFESEIQKQFFFSAPMADRNSWARDPTCATAVTRAAAVTVPDP